MSNDIYKIINNFNKLTEQKPEPTKQAVKPKNQLQESIEQVSEKYMGFKKTVAAIKKGGSAENPEAVAASIGRKKYGKEKFQKAAATGKKLGEQKVTESTGQLNDIQFADAIWDRIPAQVRDQYGPDSNNMYKRLINGVIVGEFDGIKTWDEAVERFLEKHDPYTYDEIYGKKGMAEGNDKPETFGDQFADFLQDFARKRGLTARSGPPPRREPQRNLDIDRIPELEKELEELMAEYESLGGNSWQRADYEQNLTPNERKARNIEYNIRNLQNRIYYAKKEAEQEGQQGKDDLAEGRVKESGLQAYLGKKKYGKAGMQALQKAGRAGASKEKMAKIRAKHDQLDEQQLDEKAKSKAQQKFMGMVHAAKKGEKPASADVANAAKGMSKKAAKDFAATKHKGLPQHVGEAIHAAFQAGYSKEEILESLQLLESDTDYWRELTKNIGKPGQVTKTVHKGHYGTEYQGDDDEDDDGQPKKKIAKPEGEKRGRGRPKGVKNRVVRAGEKKAAPSGEKRGRGRPAGSKNKVKESWIAENNRMIAEAFLQLVEQSAPRLPAPMEPTFKRDPKTGELVPDIDYQLNPQLKPAPVKPAPRPAPKPQQGKEKRSEIDTDSDVAEEIQNRFIQLQEPVEVELDAVDVGATEKEKEGPTPRFKELQEPVEVDLDSDLYGFDDEDAYKGRFMRSPTIDPGNLSISEMMRLAGMEGKLHGKQHKLDVDRDGDIEGDDLADLRAGRRAVDEDDMEEGNEFSGALAKAKASGAKEFKVDGKTYPVKESKLDECGDMSPMANGMSEQEGRMNVTTNMSTDGTKSVTVTADGNAALELMQILSLAGMKGQSSPMSQAEVTVVPMEEAKDERYHASTTPEEDIIPLETQLQGGDGEVAGKTKKMNKHGSARFSDNPLATKDIEESISLSFIKEYEGIKIKS
jgi:hypothetical protein